MAHAVDSPGARVTRRFYKSGISEHFQILQKTLCFLFLRPSLETFERETETEKNRDEKL